MRYAALVAAAAIALVGSAASAQTQVDGHWRKDGTYVPPHYRTNPDSNRFNNWSTQGNTNPYTGQRGTVNPYAQPNPYGANDFNRYNNSYGTRRR